MRKINLNLSFITIALIILAVVTLLNMSVKNNSGNQTITNGLLPSLVTPFVWR